MTPCQSTRKCRKTAKIQSIQDKRRHMQKESAAAQKEMRKIREEIGTKSDFGSCRTRSIRKKWSM